MADQSGTHDQFLARRFNFLGLPSEKRGGVSMAELKAELGDDHVNSLVTKIGMLVKSHNLDRLGIPEHLAVDRVLQSLTPDERRTMAEGGSVPRAEALVQAEVTQAETLKKQTALQPEELKASAKGHYASLGLGGIAAGRAAGRDGGDTGGGKEVSSYERQQAEQISKAYAMADQLHLGWAKNNPELLRLGPSAIQALADVQLREDSFKRFKSIGLDEKTIVSGARYAKKNGVDYNEASKAVEETHKILTPQEQAEHRKATERLFNAKPEEQEEATKNYNEKMDSFKAKHPEAKDTIEREQKVLRTKKEEEHKAEVKADAKEQKADAKEAKVDNTSAKGDDILKKRLAAKSAAKPAN